MPARKFLIHDRTDGEQYEHEALQVSDGAADAGEIPALNEDGFLDDSILNAATSGSDVVLKTGANGRIEQSVLPVGFGPDATSFEASEDLAANDVVNVFVDGATFKVRLASAANGRAADGFVTEGATAGEQVLVYREGTNSGVAGLTGPRVFLSTTPGRVTSTAPTGAGVIQQPIGTANSPSSFYFLRGRPTHLLS